MRMRDFCLIVVLGLGCFGLWEFKSRQPREAHATAIVAEPGTYTVEVVEVKSDDTSTGVKIAAEYEDLAMLIGKARKEAEVLEKVPPTFEHLPKGGYLTLSFRAGGAVILRRNFWRIELVRGAEKRDVSSVMDGDPMLLPSESLQTAMIGLDEPIADQVVVKAFNELLRARWDITVRRVASAPIEAHQTAAAKLTR